MYTVLLMDLVDSILWYTRHMSEDLNPIKERLENFVDDIATGDKIFWDHSVTVMNALERTHMYNGSFSGSKSAFFVKEREVLGLVVGEDRISMDMDPKKLAKMEYRPIPQNVAEPRAFIGFALFFCDLISHFSTMAAPLFLFYNIHRDPDAFVKKWSCFTLATEILMHGPFVSRRFSIATAE